MSLSPHPKTTAAALLRLGAAWLVAILLAQGVAAAAALGAGPAHRHHSVVAAGAMLDHRPWHDEVERHHHPVADLSVVIASQDVIDLTAAQAALAWAFILLAVATGWRARNLLAHALPSVAMWAATMRVARPLLRPPRG